MTEADWWAATEPARLIDWLFFDARASDRKLRLFSVAACERVRHRVHFPGILAALDLAEAFADGRIDAAELTVASNTEWGNYHTRSENHSRRVLSGHEEPVPQEVVYAEIACLYSTLRNYGRDRGAYERHPDLQLYVLEVALVIDLPDRTYPSFPRLVSLLHDIFGPLPFHDVSISPDWLTSTVLALARGIYDEKAFDRMPILADALQDAGCDNDEMLSHCRRGGWEHVRGCWVLDLLLGRPWREGA
jgi:hypothetical protein